MRPFSLRPRKRAPTTGPSAPSSHSPPWVSWLHSPARVMSVSRFHTCSGVASTSTLTWPFFGSVPIVLSPSCSCGVSGGSVRLPRRRPRLARSSSSMSWPGVGGTGWAARAAVRAKASAMRSPRRIGSVGAGHRLHRQRGRRLDVGGEALDVDPLEPRGVPDVHGVEGAGVEVGVGVLGLVDRALHHGPEGVDGPQHAGGGIEQAAGGGRVEQRRAHQVERAVAGVEGLALVEPAHAVQRQLDVAHEAGGHGPVADEGGLRAEVEDRRRGCRCGRGRRGRRTPSARRRGRRPR